MIKSFGKLTLVGILAATVLGMPIHASAEETNKTAAVPAPPKHSSIPFHGKLGSKDVGGKTITIDEKTKRTFHVTAETKIVKAGKVASLEDATVGEEVAGSYKKGEDGKLTAVSIRLGAKPDPTVKKTKTAK
jgi:hypothetical protein